MTRGVGIILALLVVSTARAQFDAGAEAFRRQEQREALERERIESRPDVRLPRPERVTPETVPDDRTHNPLDLSLTPPVSNRREEVAKLGLELGLGLGPELDPGVAEDKTPTKAHRGRTPLFEHFNEDMQERKRTLELTLRTNLTNRLELEVMSLHPSKIKPPRKEHRKSSFFSCQQRACPTAFPFPPQGDTETSLIPDVSPLC